MRHGSCVLALVIAAGLVLGSVGPVLAQGPTAAIKVEALSPQEIHDLGLNTPPSNGLRVVGQGELVYLSGHEMTGQTVTSYSWSLLEVPDGSQAVLDSTDTQWTTFIPDTTGEFVVRLEITTASGSAADTVSIVAAHYVGVGTIAGATPSYEKGQCGLCHANKVDEWEETSHATFFQEAIDGQKSDHYASYCIECHTVGYNEAPTAVNGGFDDVARRLGWTFPSELKPGNWDSLVTNFPELAQLANIQCENCHGPGSLHKGDGEKIDVSLDEGVCGKCHEEAPYHRKNLQWKRSAHSEGIPFAAVRQGCADCHSGYGFVHRVDDDVQYLEKTVGEPRVTCAVCHDPHNDTNPHQLRTVGPVTLENGTVVEAGGLGKLCMNCHKSRRDAVSYATAWHPYFGPHHGPQADMLAGTNAITFGMHIPSSSHLQAVENTCVTCHMAPTPGSPRAPEPATDWVGEHTFAMHWDGGTPDDPSDDYDNVAACRQCHGPITSFEDIRAKEDYDGDGQIESAQDEVEGLLEAVAMLLPPIGSPEVALEENPTADPGYTPLQLQAAYNYLLVHEDKSLGVHNYEFAVNLLRVTHAALTTGDVGAGAIRSITDVPNDNGRQVRLVWTRFGGDGVGPLPIKYYAIWRRVDDMAVTKDGKRQQVTVYQSLASVPVGQVRPEDGVRVVMNGELWDYAGSVPAAGLDTYSAIAPTLFDSTKTDGMHWSVFVVSGHTNVPAIYAVSAPDSGYSVDNLAPSTPTNIVATETDQGVELTWDKPVDEDFRYFAIYRSTTSGFDPTGTPPLATTTEPNYIDAGVSSGTTYYYRISAFDFAGNESAYSNEAAVLVTGVVAQRPGQVPKDFVLEQNYPNPFNPTTQIVFGLPKSAHVSVVIYDLQGKAVRTLVRGQMAAGYHRVTWDGRSDNGEPLSAGTYICRMDAGSFKFARKMVFLK